MLAISAVGTIIVAAQVLIGRSRRHEIDSDYAPTLGYMLTNAQREELHRREWARYAVAFLNGCQHIGSFSRQDVIARCPITRGLDAQPRRLITQKDWNDLVKALTDAGYMYSSATGSGILPGKTVSDVFDDRTIKYPSRRCPVVSDIRSNGKNWRN